VEHKINKGELCFLFQSEVPVQNGSAIHKWDDDITSMTYEDILATAILNKVLQLEIQDTEVLFVERGTEDTQKIFSYQGYSVLRCDAV
jgi:Zn/Cd-binding protein ZinT